MSESRQRSEISGVKHILAPLQLESLSHPRAEFFFLPWSSCSHLKLGNFCPSALMNHCNRFEFRHSPLKGSENANQVSSVKVVKMPSGSTYRTYQPCLPCFLITKRILLINHQSSNEIHNESGDESPLVITDGADQTLPAVSLKSSSLITLLVEECNFILNPFIRSIESTVKWKSTEKSCATGRDTSYCESFENRLATFTECFVQFLFLC